ncbi:MAG TPA: hypothetical protein VKA84_25140 [Gemmatimonadaceae bacterium]|nr:hypothetical protein [Gemmatimonadaceae bacterium]
MRIAPLLVAVVSLTLASAAPAQDAVALPTHASARDVIETASETIQFVGLKRWTAQMILDSLSARFPGGFPSASVCASHLMQVLEFPSATARSRLLRDADERGTKRFVEIVVVEPQDAATVERRAFTDSVADRDEWLPAVLPMRRHREVYQHALQDYRLLLGDSTLTDDYVRARPTASALRDFARMRNEAGDYDRALWTLAHDANPSNRVAAALIVAARPATDSTWWALVDAASGATERSPAPFSAAMLLRTLTRGAPRRVDWAPALPALRRAFGGAGLMTVDFVMDALVATGVDRCTAVAAMRGNERLVLSRLAAHDARTRARVRGFLSSVTGEDAGEDPAKWEAVLSRSACGPVS